MKSPRNLRAPTLTTIYNSTSEKINETSFNTLTKLHSKLKEKYPHNKHQPITPTAYGLIYIKTSSLFGFKPLQDAFYKFNLEIREATKKNGQTFIIIKVTGAPLLVAHNKRNETKINLFD